MSEESPGASGVNVLHDMEGHTKQFSAFPQRENAGQFDLPGGIFGYTRLGVFGTAPGVSSATFRDIPSVVQLGSHVEVVRVYATPVVTVMQHAEAFGYRAYEKHVGQPVSEYVFTVQVEPSVPLVKASASPFVTASRPVYFREESFHAQIP